MDGERRKQWQAWPAVLASSGFISFLILLFHSFFFFFSSKVHTDARTHEYRKALEDSGRHLPYICCFVGESWDEQHQAWFIWNVYLACKTLAILCECPIVLHLRGGLDFDGSPCPAKRGI